MRARPLSASSIKTYLQCLLKYYFQYEDKKPRMGKTDALAFGIAMHEALEELYREISITGSPPGPEAYTKVLDVYMRSATENGLKDMKTYQEGKDLLISRLDNINDNEKVLGLELEFELKTPKGTPFKGSIDKLVELDSDTVVIIDYKTSRVALTQDEADVDIQLSMYDLAVSMLFPQYKTIIGGFDYLRMGEVITHRTPEQRQLFIEFVDTIYKNICETRETNIKANLNQFCGWCEFKNYCQDYQSLITDPELVLPRISELDDENFVEAWSAVSSAKKTIDSRQRELKSEAYERFKTKKTVKGKEKELFKVQNSRINYDSRTVFNVVGKEKFVKMVNVGKSAVDRFLRDNPEHLEKVQETASFSFLSPSFRTRKKPKN